MTHGAAIMDSQFRKYVEDPRWVAFLYDVLERRDDFFNRLITVTPFYSSVQIAGYIVTVNGTPPKAIVLVSVNETSPIILSPPVRVLEPGTSNHERMFGFLRRHGVLDAW